MKNNQKTTADSELGAFPYFRLIVGFSLGFWLTSILNDIFSINTGLLTFPLMLGIMVAYIMLIPDWEGFLLSLFISTTLFKEITSIFNSVVKTIGFLILISIIILLLFLIFGWIAALPPTTIIIILLLYIASKK